MVPQKVLDTELKKSFAHFNEGRIPVSTLGVEQQTLIDARVHVDSVIPVTQ